MVSRPSLLLVALSIAACKPDPSPASKPSPASSGVTTEIQSGPLPPLPSLSLRAELDAASPIDAGQRIPIEAKIVNVSDEAVPVVAPGDGSSVGWREPHLFFTVTRVDGRAVRELDFSRCGNYDEDWSDEVRSLAPGASLELGLPVADSYFDLQTPGKYAIEVHYRYAQGRTSKGPSTAVPSSMKGVPAFELVSNKVMVDVVRALEVRLEVTGSLDAGAPKLIDDVFRVVVHNQADVARDVASPTRGGDPQLYFHVEDGVASGPSMLHGEGQTPTKTIAAGESAVVLGKDSLFEPSAKSWTVDEPGELRVQVAYQGIRSNWSTVVVR